MATKLSAGSSKNLRDSQPKFLGIKRADGQQVQNGDIIVRQRGTKFIAGNGVRVGKDHTIYAVTSGVVSFKDKRKTRFDGQVVGRKMVTVQAA